MDKLVSLYSAELHVFDDPSKSPVNRSTRDRELIEIVTWEYRNQVFNLALGLGHSTLKWTSSMFLKEPFRRPIKKSITNKKPIEKFNVNKTLMETMPYGLKKKYPSTWS